MSYFILAVAGVFGKTLVHEFRISYSHPEWNLLSSLSENGDKICKHRAVTSVKLKE